MKIKFVLFERTLGRNSIYNFSISLFILEILRFVWYVNNTLHTSHYIMSCWETKYMIEIILLNQSKLSLLGVIRQIYPLHAQFRVTFSQFRAISPERRAIFKNYRWCSVIISRVFNSNKTNLIFISYTL